MPIDRPPRWTTPPVGHGPRAALSLVGHGPLAFDEREASLALVLRLHVLLRDACLSTPADMSAKLLALDDQRRAAGVHVPTTGRALDALVERISVVRLVERLRDTIQRTGGGLAPHRRRLVVLDVLSGTPSPSPAWARPLPRLVADAAGAGGIDVREDEVARLWRSVSLARQTFADLTEIPEVTGPFVGQRVRSTATGALGEVLLDVVGASPGSAALASDALLRGRPLEHWSPSRAGGILLDPADPDHPSMPGARRAGTYLAGVSPTAFRAELSTLVVAAGLAPELAGHVRAELPDLEEDLVVWAPTDASLGAARQAALTTVRAARARCARPTRRRWGLLRRA